MRRFPVTFGLLTLIMVAFFFQTVSGMRAYSRDTGGGIAESFVQVMTEGQVDHMIALGGITQTTIGNGEYWRLVAATCLHAGIIHLTMNGWVLLQLGSVFELLFGSRRLLVLYALSAIVASLASAVFLSSRVAVGASGAIFGIVGGILALIGLIPRNRRWAGALRLQMAVWAAATLFLGFTSEGVDNAAHVGGFVAGILIGMSMRFARRAMAPMPRAGSSGPRTSS